MAYALVVAAVGSFVVLFLSIYPGVLGDLLFHNILTSCLWLPALGIGGFVLLIRMSRGPGTVKDANPGEGSPDDFAGSPKPYDPLRRLRAASTAILVLNLVLMATDIPRRLAFAISRPAFESQLADAPISPFKGAALDRRLGLYFVDRLAANPRGGIYFRTHAGIDGLGPDTMSYGFAYQPNPEGSPFGRARHTCSHLFGDWYAFEASNDY